jgi:hypothetical protein
MFGSSSSFVGGRFCFLGSRHVVCACFGAFIVISRRSCSFLGGCVLSSSVGVDVVGAEVGRGCRVLFLAVLSLRWCWWCWLKKASHVTSCDLCIMYKHAREVTCR